MTVATLGRVLATYRRTATSRSAIVLLVANAIPLVGVYFFGWSLLTILVLYWLENGIVGFWNVARILLAQGAAVTGSRDIGATPGFVRVFGSARLPAAGRAAIATFFLVHYGIFWLVHGIFVFALPSFLDAGSNRILVGCGDEDPFGNLQACGGPFGDLVWSNIAIAGAALFLSHGASFLFNYLGGGEYRTASPTGQMGAPYGRVVVLHLTIILGAFAVALLGSPVGALLLLVGLKTAFDLGLHLREHRAAVPALPPSPPRLAGPA